MQIKDIMNLEIGNQDKMMPGMIDIADKAKNQVNVQSNRFEDEDKLSVHNGTINMSNLTYGNPNGKKDTVVDSINNNETTSQQTRMTAAVTLDNQGFDAIDNLGFNAKDLDDKEFVDIADKIRIAMAKGGADISMMGDISEAAITNSSSYPTMVENALKDSNLPADNKTIEEGAIALRQVDEIKAAAPEMNADNGANNQLLSDESTKYMLFNEYEPTIANVYKAVTYSNDTATAEPVDIKGNTASLEAQFKDIIAEAGLEVNDETLNDCYWMVENRVSVTSDQLLRLQDIRGLEIGDTAKVVQLITDAVAEGNRPGDASLVDGKSMMAQARQITEGIQQASDDTIDDLVSDNKELTIGNVVANATDNSQYSSPINGTATEIATNDVVNSSYNTVVAKKQLVQIQLMMTTEANFTLMKRGMSVDTMQLSEYVDALEQLEQEFLQDVLGNMNTPEAVKLLGDSLDAVSSAKAIPDYATPLNANSMTLKSYASLEVSLEYSETVVTTTTSTTSQQNSASSSNDNNQNNDSTAAQAARVQAAAKRYDITGTEVRRDLGDSIKKAFGNINNLLQDIGLESTEENQRAVRILGYNQMEVTADNVAQAKAVDLTVSRTLDALKPGVVTEMIKSGMNPLDMTMEELYETSQEIVNTMEGSSEEDRYADFLWRLEQENGITEEEREGFIGVYRLIHKVNETDGAAIGMLLQQGSDVTMRNLLTAARSSRHQNREYTIDDDFGGIQGFNKDSLSITDQIEMSIQSASMRNVEENITPYKMTQFTSENEFMSLTPEQLSNRLTDMDNDEQVAAHEAEINEAYTNMRRQEVLESFQADQKVINYLEANNLPLTANNINAITTLMEDRNQMMSTLFSKAARRQVGLDRSGTYGEEMGLDAVSADDTLEDEIQDIMANLIHEYGEAVKTPEDMAEAEQRLEELAENVMKNMLVEKDVRSIDIRGMHLIQTQISTQGEVSKRNENYTIPIMVADEVGNLSLKIVRGKQEKGLVDIAFNMERTGTVTASFRYEAGEFTGEISSDRESTRRLLEENQEALAQMVSQNTDANMNLEFSWNNKLDVNEFAFAESSVDFETTSDKDNEVLTKSLYGVARAFIDGLGVLAS